MNKVSFVKVLWNRELVGRIALTPDGLCAFEYSAQFLNSGRSISPFELPLRGGVTIAKRHPFDGGFGVFDDCLPDGWGRLVLDRYLQKRGVNIRELDLLTRLTLVGSNGRGALEFEPDGSGLFIQDDYSDLDKLAAEAAYILKSEQYDGAAIEEFISRGGSPGGARPKIFLKYAGKEWIVKFPATGDSKKIGKIEYNYSLLAKECGVEMSENHLFEGKYFGAQRFDRTPTGKLHIVSVAGLIGADYRLPSIDYLHIFKICSALTHSISELWKVYKLMVFNFLIDNKDDHAKNFAFIYRNDDWHFAPAYDILPSSGINGYRTTSINNSVEPQKADLLAVAKASGLNLKEAEDIFEVMQKTFRILKKSL